MNQTRTTLIYVIAAAVALAIAWAARPARIDRQKTVDDSGQRFFAEFDPLEAKSMEIATFDEDSSERRAFKVAQTNGVWSIPSREDYPADAKDRLAQAAAGVMDITKGSAVS